MKEFFSMVYESWIGLYHSNFDLIFTNLFEHGGYIRLGFTFILVPLILWFAFYYFWKYPYGKIWHWILWLAVSGIIVSIISYSIANTEIFASNNQALNNAIADDSTGYKNYAESLPFSYALYNGLFAIIIGIICSFLMKQFSKVQIHLPF